MRTKRSNQRKAERWVRPLIAAFLATGAGLLARYAVAPWVGNGLPYLTFFPAVAFAGYFGGLSAGLMTAVAGAILVDLLFVSPQQALGLTTAGDWIGMIGYLVGAAAICLLLRSRTAAWRRAQGAAETAARLAAIVESSDDAIFSRNLDGTITTWNRGAERLYGYAAEEAIGNHITMILPPDRAQEEELIAERILGGQTIEHFETVRLHKSRMPVDISLTVSAIRNERGDVIGLSKIARDITPRKRNAELLRKAERLAAAGQMAATVAHEINNPLASVVNLCYLLGDEPLPQPAREYLKLAVEQLDRVVRITKQTLAFYRGGGQPVQVDLCDVVEKAVNLATMESAAERLDLAIENRRPCPIDASPDELVQVFSNLLRNAVEAGSTRLRVRVAPGRCWANGFRHGARLTLCDNGAGIEPRHRPRLFEPFFSTKEAKGTGLGLWVSKGIIDRHNGSISIRSSVRNGRSGTAVSIFLPSAAAPKRAHGNHSRKSAVSG